MLVRPVNLCPTLRSIGSLLKRSITKQFVNFNDDRFEATVDVRDYKPEELKVDVEDSTVTVEGRHEEKLGGKSFTTRQFVKKYVLPKGYYDIGMVESKLSSDGVLTVTAPKLTTPDDEYKRPVEIVKTGAPFHQ